jgi:hypothetical protein
MPDLQFLQDQQKRIERVKDELETRLSDITTQLATTLTDDERMLLELEQAKKLQLLQDVAHMLAQVQRDMEKETICPTHQCCKIDCRKAQHSCL